MKQVFDASMVRQIHAELQTALEELTPEAPAFRWYTSRLRLIKEALGRLREYVRTHAPKDEATEIHYFKELAPPLYAEFFFHYQWQQFEGQRMTVSREALEAYAQHELKGTELFLSRYAQLLRYHYAGDTHMDAFWFTRDDSSEWLPEEPALLMDTEISTGCYVLAMHAANERYRKKLENFLHNKEEPEGAVASGEIALKWVGSKSELVELCASLTAVEVLQIGGKPISGTQLKTFLETIFQVSLKEYYSLDKANRARKEEATPFLKRLINQYKKRADDLLEKN